MTDKPASSTKKRRRTPFVILSVTVLAIYVGLGVLLFAYQRDFIYPNRAQFAPVGTPEEENVAGMTDLRFQTVDGLELHGWYTPARDADKPLILFFHSNGSNMKGFYPKAKVYIDKGFGAFLCEYRGYGGNPGEPSEQGLYNDAQACLFALKAKGHEPSGIVYYGHSLGTGVAVDLASKYPPRALILESAYSSVIDMAKFRYGWYPVQWMLLDKFDSHAKIDKIKSRIFFVHGEQDETIPFTSGTKLFDKAVQPKAFHAIANGRHTDLYRLGAGDIVANWLVNQRLYMYAPVKTFPGHPEDYGLKGVKEIDVTTEDGLVLNAWFAPPAKKDGKIIVYFRRNTGNIAGMVPSVQLWVGKGYGIYVCEYRGYGGNPGNPSEEGIYSDARAGIKWLTAQGYSTAQYVYYGLSMGADVAVQMASEITPSLLVLESAAPSVLDVVHLQLPKQPRDFVAEHLTEKFDNISKVPKIHAPVLFIYGDKDKLIPRDLSRKLFDAANEPKFLKYIPDAGHGDAAVLGADLVALEWIEANAGSKEHAAPK